MSEDEENAIEPQEPLRNTVANQSDFLIPSVVLTGCGLLSVGVVIVCVLSIVIPSLGVANFIGNIFDSIGDFFGTEETATVDSSQTIVLNIRQLGQLVSVSAQVAKMDINVSTRGGIANACGRTAHHVAQGTIEAGIDLTLVEADDVDISVSTDTVTINLPPAQLTSCRVDAIRQYERTTSTCGTDWDEIRQLAQHVALNEFRDDAIEGGILLRAHNDAEIVLTNFLGLVTGKAVRVTFSEPDPETQMFAPSCFPEPPTGWEYNANEDYWE
jgi:hypothetical protein